MADLPSPSAADAGIALALGSAFLGMYAHAGFLSALDEAGIYPGHVAGASAGAIAGGLYAAGIRGAELEEVVLSRSLKRSFYDPGMLVRWIPMFIIGRLTGVMSGARVIRHLKRVLPVSRIEQIKNLKLSIAVTDLRALRGLFLTNGPLAESIVASSSVPMLISGQDIGGTRFHDGGILHELPFEHFIEDSAIHTIIIHNVDFPRQTTGSYLKVPAAFANSHQMLNDALFQFRLKRAEEKGKRVIVIDTEHPFPGFFQSQAAKKGYFDEGFRSGLSLKQKLAP